LFRFRCVGERLGRSRNYRNAIRYCKRPSRGLASQSSDCFGWWTNPDNTRITNGSREPFALGEKTVTRMNGFRASGLCDFDDPITKQIALARRGWSDQHCFIRLPDVWRAHVCLAVNSDCLDPQLLT